MDISGSYLRKLHARFAGRRQAGSIRLLKGSLLQNMAYTGNAFSDFIFRGIGKVNPERVLPAFARKKGIAGHEGDIPGEAAFQEPDRVNGFLYFHPQKEAAFGPGINRVRREAGVYGIYGGVTPLPVDFPYFRNMGIDVIVLHISGNHNLGDGVALQIGPLFYQHIVADNLRIPRNPSDPVAGTEYFREGTRAYDASGPVEGFHGG